jgi:predicted nucleotidyltransferase
MEVSEVGADLFGDVDAAVLRVLALQARPVSGREVARLSGRNQSSTRRALARWTAIGLVRGEAAAHATQFTLNRDHVLWAPLEQILLAPVKVDQAIAQLVDDRSHGASTVALFGSVARRESRADSDIDIALIPDDRMSPDEVDRLRDDLADVVERMTGNTAQVIEVTRAQLKDMVAHDDPLTRSWEDDARTLAGEDLAGLIRAAR